MTFTKRLHAGIIAGEITCTVRIWRNVRTKLGGRYAVGPGAVEVTRIQEIDLDDVTEDIARRSGFADLDDLMSVARHGRGERVFLIDFEYREGSPHPL